MADIATLGIRVDATDVDDAKRSFNEAAAAAGTLEKSSGAAGRAAETMATGMRTTGALSSQALSSMSASMSGVVAASLAAAKVENSRAASVLAAAKASETATKAEISSAATLKLKAAATLAAARAEYDLVTAEKAASASLEKEAASAAKAAAAHRLQAAAANQNSASSRSFTAATNQNADAVANGSSKLRLAALQLSQVGQQTQVTGNFLQALAIQLPDLALGFGPIGIAAGVAAGAILTYFSTFTDGSAASERALEKQEELIRSVAETWGDAVPALRGYVDELDRAKLVSDTLAAGKAAGSHQFDDLRSTVEDLNIKLTATVRDMQDAGAQSEDILKLQNAWNRVQKAVAENRSDTAAMMEAQDALSSAFRDTSVPAISELAEQFLNLGRMIAGADKAARGFSLEAIAALAGGTNVQDIVSSKTFTDPSGRAHQTEGFLPEFGPMPGANPLRNPSLDHDDLYGKPKKTVAKRDDYASAVRTAADRTKAIEAETAAQGALNPLVNDYSYAITKAKTSADLLAAGEKQKVAITPQVIAQIDQTSSALARATAEQNKQTEAIQKSRQYVDFLKSTTAGFVNDLRQGLRNGEGFWKSFGSAALNVFDRITDRLLNQVLDAVFKVGDAAGGAGGSGGLFGGLFKLFGLGGSSSGFDLGAGATAYTGSALPAFASGTSSAPSGLALMGERGPELVRFRGGEQVIPNHRLQSAANQNSSGSSGSSNVHVTAGVEVDDAGNLKAYVKSVAQEESSVAVRQGISRYDAGTVGRTAAAMKEATKRRIA